MSLLADIRVVDIAGHLAEATGRVLADLGAEVVKVEPVSYTHLTLPTNREV